jgi:hypothetical protein
MLGDLSAKVGKEMASRGTTGVHSLHEASNVNGCKLIDFAMSKNMVIISTCSQENMGVSIWHSI